MAYDISGMAAVHLVIALMRDRIDKGEMDRSDVDAWIDRAATTARLMQHDDVVGLIDVQLRKLAHTVARHAGPDDDPGASVPDEEKVVSLARKVG